MGDEDVQCVAMAAPQAKLYLTHLDNVSHASLTRHTLRGRLAERGVMNYDRWAVNRVLIISNDRKFMMVSHELLHYIELSLISFIND